MTAATDYSLPFGDVYKTPHSGERNHRSAQQNLILLSEVGSRLHGTNVGGDDQDMQGVFIDPPEVMLGTREIELYEYRTQPVGVRSGDGDIDLNVYCHDPAARVLTADLEWREIGSLQVGERLISFDETDNTPQRHRHFSTGIVTAMQERAMPRLRVITSEGETIVTPEHAFLTRYKGKPRTRWTTAAELRPGTEIYSVPTWGIDRSWGGGYLAGQFDGEASLCFAQVNPNSSVSLMSWAQKATSPDVPFMELLLADRGFKTRKTHSHGCVALHVAVDWWEQARFLGSIRPRRLLRHPLLSQLWEGRSLQVCGRAIVEAVEPISIGSVVAMEVDTHTYIADGLLTHNSLQKWIRLILNGNPSILLPLFAPAERVYYINWAGQELRDNAKLFLAKDHAKKFLGYLNSQRQHLTGERAPRVNRPELIAEYGFDTKYASTALRIAIQGAQLMRSGALELPMSAHERRYLIDVRQGRYTLGEVLKKLGNLESELMDTATYSTVLPAKIDYDYVDNWLVDIYQRWWARTR